MCLGKSRTDSHGSELRCKQLLTIELTFLRPINQTTRERPVHRHLQDKVEHTLEEAHVRGETYSLPSDRDPTDCPLMADLSASMIAEESDLWVSGANNLLEPERSCRELEGVSCWPICWPRVLSMTVIARLFERR